KYIGLTPGGLDEFLQEGDTIELTQSALVLERLISKFLFNSSDKDK
ncbi:MAG: outer membrane lipid asymmetry maintenance protein MlaD, partial [Gammaproteobacteria bacterium]